MRTQIRPLHAEPVERQYRFWNGYDWTGPVFDAPEQARGWLLGCKDVGWVRSLADFELCVYTASRQLVGGGVA